MFRQPFLQGLLLVCCCIGGVIILGNVGNFQHLAPPSTLSVRANRTGWSSSNIAWKGSATLTDNAQGKRPSLKCLLGSRRVNGTEFSDVWPNHTSPQEVWSHPTTEVNDNMTTWHPSDFAKLCATHGDLGPSFYAPPRYQSKDRPTGLHMVMTGDSIMRYQFIMLTHFLHTGHWIHDSMQPNLLRETSLGGDGGWPAFYRAMERYYESDNMISDAYRHTDFGRWPELMFENEFYIDKECLDNSITYFSRFSYGLRGYRTPSDINNWFHSTDKNESNILVPESIYEEGNFSWSYNDYDQFLRHVVIKLEPRPRVFVFNQGLWPGAVQDLSNVTLLRQIQNTIHELGMVSIYKTTSRYNSETTPGLAEYEELCCQVFDYCLRMDWTACMPRSEYWDTCHMLAYPNLRTNEQLFDILEQAGMMPASESK